MSTGPTEGLLGGIDKIFKERAKLIGIWGAEAQKAQDFAKILDALAPVMEDARARIRPHERMPYYVIAPLADALARISRTLVSIDNTFLTWLREIRSSPPVGHVRYRQVWLVTTWDSAISRTFSDSFTASDRACLAEQAVLIQTRLASWDADRHSVLLRTIQNQAKTIEHLYKTVQGISARTDGSRAASLPGYRPPRREGSKPRAGQLLQSLRVINKLYNGSDPLEGSFEEPWNAFLHDVTAFRVLFVTSRAEPVVRLNASLVEDGRCPLDILNLILLLSRRGPEDSHTNKLEFSAFLELYTECTGAPYIDSRLDDDRRPKLVTDISLHGRVRSSDSLCGWTDAVVDCVVQPRPHTSGSWDVLLIVAHRSTSRAFEPILAALVNRKNSREDCCNCDLGFRHIPHSRELWTYGKYNPDFHPESAVKEQFSEFNFDFNGQLSTLRLWRTSSVGQGAGGRVCRGDIFYANRRDWVAVKIFPAVMSAEEQELMAREIKHWRALSSPRILPFYGIVEVGWNQFGLISPFMMNGTLAQFLHANPSENRLGLIKDVAEGVAYLHDEARIVHGDLKCENILVSNMKTALIADFGLSTLVDGVGDPTSTGIRIRNTLRFAAPELLMDTAISSSTASLGLDGAVAPRSKTGFSDMYAFGMLIYQAYTGKLPWDGLNETQIVLAISSGKMPQVPKGRTDAKINEHLWKLCQHCWRLKPANRPRAKQAFDIISDIAEYPDYEFWLMARGSYNYLYNS